MSDANKGEIKFSYGGQAVIEGVMMRGAHMAAIAVRDAFGQVVVHEQPISAVLYRSWMAKTPFVRGVVGLWDALGLGTRALMWAADVVLESEEEKERQQKAAEQRAAHPIESSATTDSIEDTPPAKKASVFDGPLGWGTMALSLAFGVGLFFLLPTAAATGFQTLMGWQGDAATTTTTLTTAAATVATVANQPPVWLQHLWVNLFEGVFQLFLVMGYMWAIGFMPDVRRLYGYHGAEHKTINAYEAGAELTPEIVQQYPIEHPRCGTAFLLTVVFVSVLVFSLFGRPDWPLLILSRVICIPLIAGIAYEFLRFTARNIHNPLIRLIVIPNLALQHLTTRQPDLQMIEVAIVAFKRVLYSEGLISEEAAKIPEKSKVAVGVEVAVTR
jgi:uncharacterized protein YqhQ